MNESRNPNKLGCMSWMRNELRFDPDAYDDCGEIDRTLLAENAADALELYADDFDATIPEWVFELAHDIATEVEDAT